MHFPKHRLPSARCRVAALAALLPLGSAIAGTAVPGPQAFVADPAFATDGAAILDFEDAFATWDEPLGQFPDGNGGYWVIGLHRATSGTDRLAIGKLDADGQPDTTFGDQGKLTANVAGTQINAATMDGDRVYVAAIASGANGTDFGVSCLLVDGTPCPGFGMAGQVLVPFDASVNFPNDIPKQITVRDGALYVSGEITTDADNGGWNTANGVARLDAATGELDAQFGNLAGKPGRSVFNLDLIPDGADYNVGVALSNDGSRLLLAGSADDVDADTGLSLQDAFVLGIDPQAGTLDADFADAGTRIIRLPPGDNFGQFVAKHMLLRHNGRIVVVGDYRHDVNGMVQPEIALAELDADGAFTAGFGDGGISHVLIGNNTETQGVAERPGSGRLVVAAQNDGLDPGNGTDHQQSLVEFDTSGLHATSAIVFTFPADGTDTGPRSYPKGVVVDDANRSLILGWRNWQFTTVPFVLNRDITLSRFLDDDAIFGNDFGGTYAD